MYKMSGWVIVVMLYFVYDITTAMEILDMGVKRNDQVFDATLCEKSAACGMVQVNSRGTTAMPLCSCPSSGYECPLNWDLGDGKSVNQGFVQYKHCTDVAINQLKYCKPDETAYAMMIISPFSDEDANAMKVSHKVYCTCPENYQHKKQGENSEQIPYIGEVQTYSYTCAPYPLCEKDQVCKTISETKDEFLENRLCACAEGSHCPVERNRRAKTIEFGLGRITQLFCQ